MTKLSDTQAILLSSAAQRPNGSLYPLPASIAGGARLAKPISGLVTRGLAEERGTGVADETHRTEGDLRFGLFITPAGEAAIGVGEEVAADSEPAPQPQPQPEPAEPAGPEPAQSSPRQTKAVLVLGLLGREHGATLPELIAATGWLPHTTRAALTGLRKKGHDVQRGKRDGATCYSVASMVTATAAEGAR